MQESSLTFCRVQVLSNMQEVRRRVMIGLFEGWGRLGRWMASTETWKVWYTLRRDPQHFWVSPQHPMLGLRIRTSWTESLRDLTRFRYYEKA